MTIRRRMAGRLSLPTGASGAEGESPTRGEFPPSSPAGWEKMSETIAAALRTIEAKGVSITTPTAPWVHVVITFPDHAHAARTATALQNGRPCIFVAAHRISNAELVVIPQNLDEEEVPVLITRLREAIEGAARV